MNSEKPKKKIPWYKDTSKKFLLFYFDDDKDYEAVLECLAIKVSKTKFRHSLMDSKKLAELCRVDLFEDPLPLIHRPCKTVNKPPEVPIDKDHYLKLDRTEIELEESSVGLPPEKIQGKQAFGRKSLIFYFDSDKDYKDVLECLGIKNSRARSHPYLDDYKLAELCRRNLQKEEIK